jgi:hypothetical protein
MRLSGLLSGARWMPTVLPPQRKRLMPLQNPEKVLYNKPPTLPQLHGSSRRLKQPVLVIETAANDYSCIDILAKGKFHRILSSKCYCKS